MYEIIHDIETGEVTQRDFTTKEITDAEKAKLKAETEQAKHNAEEAKKAASRQAVLDKLGLTTEEIAALLS